MEFFAHRAYGVLLVTLLIQACGNKGELTLQAPPVSNEDLKLISADETGSEDDANKKKARRRE